MIDLQNLRDPFVAPNSTYQRDDGMYVWRMRSGVLIVSSVPLQKFRWWDYTYPHLIWSYSSWFTLILDQGGNLLDFKGHKAIAKVCHWPRRALKKRGWW